MARKKNAKNAKNTKAKKTSTQRHAKSAAGTHPLEKSFHETPAKLAAQYRKELTGVNQQAKKLQSEIKKAHAHKKNLKKQQLALTAKNQKSPTAANKKSLAAIKQHNSKNAKTITDLTTQLNALKAEIKLISSQQAKFVALEKHLTAFAKQWQQKLKAAAKPKTRKKMTKRVKTTQHAPKQVETQREMHDTINISHEVEPVE